MTRRLLLYLFISLSLCISAASATFIPTGLEPTTIAVADFNGDCNPDFATADQATPSITIRFGDGTGGFPTSHTIASAASPLAIAAGDFNEDGHPDLAVELTVFGPTPAMTILINNGDGTFTSHSGPTAGGSPRLRVADVNGDGHLDLIAPEPGNNTVAVFLGDGSGNFGAPAHVTVTNSFAGPADVVVVDLNGDGKLDLAAACGNSVGIVFGNGDGTFGAPTNIAYADPSTPVAIAYGDVDHDGDIDLATANGNVVGGGSVLINNGSGSFTLHSFSMPSVPTDPLDVALADLDGDGNLDIITANQFGCPPDGSNLSVRHGNGDGTFGPSSALSVGYTNCIDSQFQPNNIAVLDLNCDGKADLLVTLLNKNFISEILSSGGTDSTPPTITAPANISVSAGASCSATVSDLGTPTVSDNCGCATATASGVPAGNVYPLGVTTITWTAHDAHGNTATATQTVTVTDDTPPALAPASDVNATADASCTATVPLTPPAATDNCPGTTVSGTRSDALSLAAPYPTGTTVVTWTAHDAHGNTSSETQNVIVTAPPPAISGASASPNTLWPPNHKLIDVTVNYSASGGCGGATTCIITSITSNEPVNGLGDGDQSPDWQFVDAHHVKLRAERDGSGTGRVYTLTITCSDGGGHSATSTVTVNVPVNQK